MTDAIFWSRSLPALTGDALFPSESPSLPGTVGEILPAMTLVPAYHVSPSGSPALQQRQLVRAISTVAERLTRLEEAYHTWDLFDPGPYFDWYPQQAKVLCRWREQTGRMFVTVYADLLVPSFRSAIGARLRQRDLASRLTRAARGLPGEPSSLLLLWQPSETAFRQQLEQAQEAISGAVRQLCNQGIVDFVSSHAALDEQKAVATRYNGHGDHVYSLVHEVPTLTLARSFPLAPRRQPGRRQRLVRHRLRARASVPQP